MKKGLIIFFAIMMVTTFAFAGGQQEGAAADAGAAEESGVTRELPADAVVAGQVNANETLPDGTPGESPEVLTVSSSDEQELKDGDYTAAIVMHYLASSWSQQQVAGMKSVFDKYGVEVVSVTGAESKPDVQMNNIESVLALNPDVICSIPVDQSAETPAYMQISESPSELILIDMVPHGLEHGKDYSSLVSSSNYGNGVSAADIMAASFIEMGISSPKVITGQLNFEHYVTEERLRGFEERVAEAYPWIEIVDSYDFPFNDQAMYEQANGALTRNPNIDGAFVIWMGPATHLVSAARENGRTGNDFVITTVDLEEDGAMEIAQEDGFIKGTGAQDPFSMGQANAKAAVRAILGYDNPPFVAVPGYAISRENIVEGYKKILGEEPPAQLKEAAN